MSTLKTTSLLALVVSMLLPCRTAGAQAAPAAQAGPRTGTLVIAGDVGKTVTLTPEQMKGLARTSVTIEEDGRPVQYDGVLVGDLLKLAGRPVGADPRVNAVATYVVATANDGYRVVFSFAELDPVFTKSRIIVADTADGKPLFDYQGPFKMIVPGDTRAARSVRMLEKLELVRLPK